MATVQIQGIGARPAVPAEQLRAGMIILWNYGYTSTVVSVVPSSSGKTLTLTTRNAAGKEFSRKTTRSRLFAIA